jgi:hypothetical protein
VSDDFSAEAPSAICLALLFLRQIAHFFERSWRMSKIGRIGALSAYDIDHPAPFGMDE